MSTYIPRHKTDVLEYTYFCGCKSTNGTQFKCKKHKERVEKVKKKCE